MTTSSPARRGFERRARVPILRSNQEYRLNSSFAARPILQVPLVVLVAISHYSVPVPEAEY